MDYLAYEILVYLIVAFAIGFITHWLLRDLTPARGAAGDRVAMAESLAAARETEARHLRSEVDTMKEQMRRTEAEAAAAQSEVARTGAQLSATRIDLSSKIVALEEEIAALKRPKPVAVPQQPKEPAVVVAPSIAAAPPPAVAPPPPPIATPVAPPVLQLTTAEIAPVVAASTPIQPAAPSVSPLASLPPDDLKEIVGIGPILEHTLQSLGLKTFAQIATITPEDVAMLIVKVDSSIAERVLRERWVEQARDLYTKKYGQAA